MSGRNAAAAAVALGLAAAAVAWSWRTGAVGGSDSACYALMARVLADGAWQPRSPLAADAPWPDATRVAAPAGFLPSLDTPGAAVPVCAPGYSVLVAPLVRAFDARAVHAVPPLATAALVWCAFLLGRRLRSASAGLAGATLVASTPIVLFQAVQPMNDIATGALWMGAAVAICTARPLATGLLVGVALLVRPNLALAAVTAVVLVGILVAADQRTWRPSDLLRAMILAVVAAAPPVLLALLLNDALYGSPLRSGYGDLGALFAVEHVPVNLARYGGTWIATGTPLVLLGCAAPWLVARARRRETLGVAILAASIAVVYLAYRPFDEWWYLRFLLPAVALAAVLAAVALEAVADRVWPRRSGSIAVAVAAAAAWFTVQSPYAREAFALHRLEARFATTAAVVAERFDSGVVPIAIWQSGGLRFWPGRDVLVWDALDPQWLDRAIEWLQIHGRPAIIVVERWEEPGFRERFAGQTFGALDWPPRFDVDRRVRIFVPEDRERYLQGESLTTETVFSQGRR